MNPSLYEINTRVWIKRFDTQNLINIPENYWISLKSKGIDYVWLMGVWKTCSSVIEQTCFEDGLVESYSRALKDWVKDDVIGSPYAIDIYEINPLLGDENTLSNLKNKLNSFGLKLILDFVPNHFNVGSELLGTNPGVFLRVNKEDYEKDSHTFFKYDHEVEKYFAHGRDPFFPAWQDTVQVNYSSFEAREYMTDVLLRLAKLSDGVRCDMAMLPLNNVFKNTWGRHSAKDELKIRQNEFWIDAIAKVKSVNNDFKFIAEVYWDMEWELQQLGFDYTYDKRLTDRLRFGNAYALREHLQADNDFQKKSVRFIENHDETRGIAALGRERSKAAAVITSTLQGMHLYYDGQFEGKKVRLPVQLGREPKETPSQEIMDFYDKLLPVVNNDIFKSGEWKMLKPLESWEGNSTFHNLLAWQWKRNGENRVIVVNYSDIVSTCRLIFDVAGCTKEIKLTDLLNNQTYNRSAEEIHTDGLYVELKPWQSHIFEF